MSTARPHLRLRRHAGDRLADLDGDGRPNREKRGADLDREQVWIAPDTLTHLIDFYLNRGEDR